MKSKRTLTFVGIILLILLILIILTIHTNHSTPEKAIENSLKNVKINYTIVKDDFIDPVYGQRYYIKEANDSHHDSIPHIFYLQSNALGWFIKSSGNVP